MIELIKYKLDLSKPQDYLKAEKAILKLILEDPLEDSEMEVDGRDAFTYRVASQQNLLLKL